MCVYVLACVEIQHARWWRVSCDWVSCGGFSLIVWHAWKNICPEWHASKHLSKLTWVCMLQSTNQGTCVQGPPESSCCKHLFRVSVCSCLIHLSSVPSSGPMCLGPHPYPHYAPPQESMHPSHTETSHYTILPSCPASGPITTAYQTITSRLSKYFTNLQTVLFSVPFCIGVTDTPAHLILWVNRWQLFRYSLSPLFYVP